MATPTHSGRWIGTGLFEVDLVSGEVLRQGRRLPLQEQPFRVLLLLLEHPGQVVTRDELQSKLWPGDTYVSFDEGLNTAIRKLRVLFGDSAENPRFIETLPRRGYRFIAPVRELADGEQIPAELQKTTSGLETADAQQARLSETVSAPSQGKFDWKLVIPVAAAAILLLISWAGWYTPPRMLMVTHITRITNDRKAKIPVNGIVTDGMRLYFIEGMPWGSGSGIAQVSIVGGETTWIPTDMKEVLAIADISPDKSKLLVNHASGGDADEFWEQPLPAGTPHRVGNLNASAMIWTPDGAHILYSNQHKILIANEDGTNSHAIGVIPGIARWMRFSPDGTVIRFSLLRAQGNASSIWEMRADGTNLHQFLPDWKESPDVCCGRWSPDGDYYYFLTGGFFLGGFGSGQAIWALPEHHSIFGRAPAPVRLNTGPLRYSTPTPSSDGKSIFAIGDESRVELFAYDPQTKQFDPYFGGLSAGPIASSPDGKWIAYISYPEMTLWKCRPDLSEKMQLTFPPVRAFGPRWSPDGSRIAFTDVQFHHPWKASLISVSGGGTPKPIVPSDDADTDPAWTPDGKAIIFARAGEEGRQGIYRIDLRTGNLTRIPGSEATFSPRLSPDGRYIAALIADGAKRLMLLDQNTNTWSTLAEGEHFGFNEWSPNGKYVYVRESGGGFARIVRVRIKDRVQEDVLSLKGFPSLVDPFAAWYGLTADGKILLMRDRSVQEIYALDLAGK